jgi:hypothetical protein
MENVLRAMFYGSCIMVAGLMNSVTGVHSLQGMGSTGRKSDGIAR